MLIATVGRKLFSLAHRKYTVDELKRLKKIQQFTCPACNEKVMLKVGTIKTPHFAHYSSSQCAYLFSDGESQKHLQGKQDLFTLFERLNYPVQLEPYIQSIMQRPDLLVKYNRQHYAIEFQCSTIEIERVEQRTENYLKENINPWWILATPERLANPTKAFMKVRLSTFEQHFIKKAGIKRFIITYNVDEKQFVYLSDLLHLSGNSYIATITKCALFEQTFPFLYPKHASFSHFRMMYNEYKRERDKLIDLKRFSKKGVQDLLLRSLYELRIHRKDIPLYIGLPLRDSDLLKINPIEWQAALFYYCLQEKCSLKQLTTHDINRFLSFISIHPTEEKIKVVSSYVKFLNAIGITNVQQKIPEQQIIEMLYHHIVAL